MKKILILLFLIPVISFAQMPEKIVKNKNEKFNQVLTVGTIVNELDSFTRGGYDGRYKLLHIASETDSMATFFRKEKLYPGLWLARHGGGGGGSSYLAGWGVIISDPYIKIDSGKVETRYDAYKTFAPKFIYNSDSTRFLSKDGTWRKPTSDTTGLHLAPKVWVDLNYVAKKDSGLLYLTPYGAAVLYAKKDSLLWQTKSGAIVQKDTTKKVGIGTNRPFYKFHINTSNTIPFFISSGNSERFRIYSDGYNIGLGIHVFDSLNSGYGNIGYGIYIAQSLRYGAGNYFSGSGIFPKGTTSVGSVLIGNDVCSEVLTTIEDLIIGDGCISRATDIGYNVILGNGAGAVLSSAYGCTIIGRMANSGNLLGDGNLNTSGNTIIGNNAGYYNSGSNNVLLGFGCDTIETESNRLAIGVNQYDSTTILIYGNFITHWLRLNADIKTRTIQATGGNSTQWNTAYSSRPTGGNTHDVWKNWSGIWGAHPDSVGAGSIYTGTLPIQITGTVIALNPDTLVVWYDKMNKGKLAYGWGNWALGTLYPKRADSNLVHPYGYATPNWVANNFQAVSEMSSWWRKDEQVNLLASTLTAGTYSVTVTGNTSVSGTNTGDNAVNSNYSALVASTSPHYAWSNTSTSSGVASFHQLAMSDIFGSSSTAYATTAGTANGLSPGSYSISVTGSSGSCTGNSTTATNLSLAGTNGYSYRYISGAWRAWPDSVGGGGTHTIDSIWHTPAGVAYASSSTFTFTGGTAAIANMVKWSLVRAVTSNGATLKVGYISAVSGTSTITCTVVMTADLASGDQIKVAVNQKKMQYERYITVPGEAIADTGSQGMYYLNNSDTTYILPIDFSSRKAAAGTGASTTFNIRANYSTLFSSAPDLATARTLTAQRLTTFAVNPGKEIDMIIPASAGATNKASGVQARLVMVPSTIFRCP